MRTGVVISVEFLRVSRNLEKFPEDLLNPQRFLGMGETGLLKVIIKKRNN